MAGREVPRMPWLVVYLSSHLPVEPSAHGQQVDGHVQVLVSPMFFIRVERRRTIAEIAFERLGGGVELLELAEELLEGLGVFGSGAGASVFRIRQLKKLLLQLRPLVVGASIRGARGRCHMRVPAG